MAEILKTNLIDFFREQFSIVKQSTADFANTEMLNKFLDKCNHEDIDPTIENLFSYLKIYRKHSSFPDYDFSQMQMNIEGLLNEHFKFDDIIVES